MGSQGSRTFDCEGWWEQDAYGRQSMDELELRFDGNEIHGKGYDMIGLFTLDGGYDQEGRVLLRKQYIGKHSVEYVGYYDGEGTLSGEWAIEVFHGKWLIKLHRQRNAEDAPIFDFAPAT